MTTVTMSTIEVAERAPCRAVIARTDPNEQESVVLLDEEGRGRP